MYHKQTPHEKKKRNPQHLECSDFYVIQRTGEKPDYSLKSLGTAENAAKSPLEATP